MTVTALAGTSSSALAQAAPGAQPEVAFTTTMGEFRVALDPARAPKTVANFLSYVKSGQYDGTVFHRVIPGFMVQAGGYDAALNEKPTRAPIPIESQNGLKNSAGTLAMARTADPNSATAQFFINTVDNPNLDYPRPDGNGYAVFGKVVAGMDVIKRIEAVPTTRHGAMANVPTRQVVIEQARIVKP
ncbi:peptidylprolyl isomerase [Chitinasiproducens palmae]|nr:peptidylprolyl isomerase [Chitinasiproducens palmae]